jgi:1-acylglycerol-3-phosphate O-acyltransferase
VIASSSVSPIDPLYLAAIFDPLFVAAYPSTRLVEPISLFTAILRTFLSPKPSPSPSTNLLDLETLLHQHPDRIIVVFPECTTSNGRGILPLSPCLLNVPAKTKVFPIHLRYTPNDVTTPIPHDYVNFFWNLCGRPSHCIRIRIAEVVYNTSRTSTSAKESSKIGATTGSNYASSFVDHDGVSSDADTLVGSNEDGNGQEMMTREERAFLDKVAEALARLGRAKRVGLGVREKLGFIEMWRTSRSRW